MRRLVLLIVFYGGAMGISGYLQPGSSADHKEATQVTPVADIRTFGGGFRSDSQRKASQPLNTDEELRQIEDEWAHCWFTDQPSHLTYHRISGSLE